jgi:hypothetical protein
MIESIKNNENHNEKDNENFILLNDNKPLKISIPTEQILNSNQLPEMSEQKK